MAYVLASVLCSVLVSVLLKLAKRFGVDIGQAVAWNYLAACVLAAGLLPAPLTTLGKAGAPWLALAALGLLLPTIFLALAASVRHAGIVRSEVAQRLSLLLSLLAAFVLFGEPATVAKLVGIALGLLGLLGMIWRPVRAATDAPVVAARWGFPLLVFLGFGVIDVLFKRVAQAGVPLGAALLAMFVLALAVSVGLQGWRLARARTRPDLRSFAGGLLLGLLNFGNILYYLRAHQALPGRPSLVFAGMNLGVVALGALVGMVVFRERLSRINLAGLLLAALAIGVLA